MFEITSYLHKVTPTEYGEVLFIVAELKDGTRFSHSATFPCYSAEFGDLHESARAEAENLLRCIKVELQNWEGLNADALDPDHWTMIAPAYNSKAYVDMDMEGVYGELKRCQMVTYIERGED